MYFATFRRSIQGEVSCKDRTALPLQDLGNHLYNHKNKKKQDLSLKNNVAAEPYRPGDASF
jgi:hypothetical protein